MEKWTQHGITVPIPVPENWDGSYHSAYTNGYEFARIQATGDGYSDGWRAGFAEGQKDAEEIVTKAVDKGFARGREDARKILTGAALIGIGVLLIAAVRLLLFP